MVLSPRGERAVVLAFVVSELLVSVGERADPQLGAAQDGAGAAGRIARDPVAADPGERLRLRGELRDERRGRPLGAVEHQPEQFIGERGMVPELLDRGQLGIGRTIRVGGSVVVPERVRGGDVDGSVRHADSVAEEVGGGRTGCWNLALVRCSCVVRMSVGVG